MKKIFLEIAGLLILIGAVFMLLEYLYRDYRSGVDRIMDDFLTEHQKAEVLLVGNSHTVPLYRKLKVDGNTNVACLTIGGDDLFWMQALVKNYINDMHGLKYILLNCDDELLGFNQSFSGLKYLNRLLYPYADTMYGNLFIDKLLARSNFFRSNRDIGYLFNKQTNEDILITGMTGGTGTFSDEECKSRAIEISDRRFDKRLFNENLIYLRSIINVSKQKGVKLFIFKMPKCECVRESMVKENLEMSRQKLDSIFRIYRIEVFDFTNDTSFHRADFNNLDHLSIQASGKLLEQLEDRIYELEGQRLQLVR